MKVQNVSPKFIISKSIDNPVISTKDIVAIRYNDFNNTNIHSPDKTIIFNIRNCDSLFWRFDTKEIALSEYQSVIELLNKTMIEY